MNIHCELCGGTGELDDRRCPSCAGTGLIYKLEKLNSHLDKCTGCVRDKEHINDCRAFIDKMVNNGGKSCQNGYIYKLRETIC